MEETRNNKVTATFNKKSRLYNIEYVSKNGSKGVFCSPRYVRDKDMLIVWVNERVRDKTFPEWFSQVEVSE